MKTGRMETLRRALACYIEDCASGDEDEINAVEEAWGALTGGVITVHKKYTVWVCQEDGRGTHHVSSHKARTPLGAAAMAIEETARDWELKPPSQLQVLGIVEGDVHIVEWNDEIFC